MVANVMSTAGWLAIGIAFAVWEVGGYLFDYPRVGNVLSFFTHVRTARLVIYGFWMWLGWHFFIRGWVFFLQRHK
jgi:hypothetical protein